MTKTDAITIGTRIAGGGLSYCEIHTIGDGCLHYADQCETLDALATAGGARRD